MRNTDTLKTSTGPAVQRTSARWLYNLLLRLTKPFIYQVMYSPSCSSLLFCWRGICIWLIIHQQSLPHSLGIDPYHVVNFTQNLQQHKMSLSLCTEFHSTPYQLRIVWEETEIWTKTVNSELSEKYATVMA